MSKFKHKITVIGDGFVGKTSLITKFTQGGFQEEYIKTIGAQFSEYIEERDGDRWELFFWDIAGQDEFHFLRPAFYRSSVASIIVFSLEENDLGRNSFKHVTDWCKEIKKFCGEIPIILFGNKVDLVDESKLDDQKILKLVNKNNFIDYYHTSAKTGQNVEEAFKTIIEELQNKYKEKKLVQNP
ncbi:MAG: Rab family GTPase [Promethearchaeota archaeon]